MSIIPDKSEVVPSVGDCIVNGDGTIGVVTSLEVDCGDGSDGKSTYNVTKIVAGSGIAISPVLTSYASICYSGMDAELYSRPDTETLLKNAVREHEADRSISIKAGTAYFCDDGSLFVECSLPCSNMLHILVDEHDAVKSCDEAMRVLEDMKSMISEMQEKVFELSLSQKVKDD
jgi:hypothetical protein